MSAYDKLAVCLFNFKCKAPERGGASELEGEQNMMENGARGRGREGGEKPAYCWQRGQRERSAPQMLDVSVRGTDKAARNFESRMPTSWGLGVLAVRQHGNEVGVVVGVGGVVKGDKA